MNITSNYEYFLTIVEEGSITRAAERLFITQPALSKYLHQLESQLNTPLFSRNTYPITLTEAGKLYKSFIEHYRMQEKLLQRDLSEFQEGIFGSVTLAMTPWRSSLILPLLIPYMQKNYPHIKLGVQEGDQSQIYSWLDREQVDFALMHTPNKYQGITFRNLGAENVLMAVHPDNPTLKRLNPPPQRTAINHLCTREFLLFKDDPFILRRPGQHLRYLVDTFFDDIGFVPNVSFVLSDTIGTLNLVSAGIGNAFVSRATFGYPEHYEENLYYFTLGDPPLHWNLCIAYKSSRILSLPAIKVIRLLESTILSGSKSAAQPF